MASTCTKTENNYSDYTTGAKFGLLPRACQRDSVRTARNSGYGEATSKLLC